jgi:photosystem II stability/assembly factor-like uncharacterized protein
MARYSVRTVWVAVLAGAMTLGTCLPVGGVQASAPPMRISGGAAWHAETSGTQQPLFAVSCFDALRCKAVGANGAILSTRNAGGRWYSQRNPLAGSSTVLYRIACVGRSTCYVVGRPNVVLVTRNGGVTWRVHRFLLPGSTGELTDTQCVNAQVFDIRGRLALCRLGLLDVSCLSASTCVVVGTVHVEGQLGDLGAVVYVTTDGGATWTGADVPATAPCEGDCGAANTRIPYPLEWVSCGSSASCRAGGSTFIGSHEGYATLIITTRTLETRWNPVGSSAAPAPDSARCPTAARCYGVWSSSPFNPPNEIWLSSDGGASWTQHSSGSTKLRNAIACPAARTCYSVGNQGTITASLNGSPFASQRSGTSHDLYGVTCVGVQVCFAVGNRGTIVTRGSR